MQRTRQRVYRDPQVVQESWTHPSDHIPVGARLLIQLAKDAKEVHSNFRVFGIRCSSMQCFRAGDCEGLLVSLENNPGPPEFLQVEVNVVTWNVLNTHYMQYIYADTQASLRTTFGFLRSLWFAPVLSHLGFALLGDYGYG